jgi:hypothetical protein
MTSLWDARSSREGGSYYLSRGGLTTQGDNKEGVIMIPSFLSARSAHASRNNLIFRIAREGILTSKTHLIIICDIICLFLEKKRRAQRCTTSEQNV